MSVVSAGGILGFFGVTVIFWPVVAAGLATVGTLMALGGYKVTSLKSRVIRRYRKAIKKSIDDQVLGYESDQVSIRQQLQSNIQHTAEKIIMEIDQC